MSEKIIEEVYERWGNTWGFPPENLKEKIFEFAKLLLIRMEKPLTIVKYDKNSTYFIEYEEEDTEKTIDWGYESNIHYNPT